MNFMAPPTARGGNKIFDLVAPMKSNWLAKIKALVMPQPAQGIFVTNLKIQGIEKGV